MADNSQITNSELVYDNLNYLMSGPLGLGQNFSGFSAYTNAYLTGTPRAPFSAPITTTPAPLWYSTAGISNITPLNVDPGTGETRTIEVFFAGAPLATVPFSQGDTVTISGVTPGYYDDTYDSSVLTCTDSSVVLQTVGSYAYPAYVSGGTITKNNSDTITSTDANALVTVYGPTDRVFISAQSEFDIAYTASVASEYNVVVQVNRYQAYYSRSQKAIRFALDGTISEQVYNYTPSTSGSQIVPETVFASVIDSPNFGYYWYILEITFEIVSGDVLPITVTAGLRGLTAQVVKQ
jgi:hypothetical protein